MDVEFKNSLTQEQYEALVTKDAGTLYFISDTKRIYKGSELFSRMSNVLNVTFDSDIFTIEYKNGSFGYISFANYLDEKLDKKPNGTDNLIDINGKIAPVYLPDSLLGQMTLCGTFNASDGEIITDLRSPAGRDWRLGDYLINLAPGNLLPDASTYDGFVAVGDWAWFDGTDWDVIPNTDAVSSVNGKTGAVVLSKSDIGLGNVDNVQQASKTEFDTHDTDDVRHITSTERLNWDSKTSVVVENILTSSSTANALSAAQGKALNDRLAATEYSLTWG